MPDLSHLWQRFVLACALLFGLAIGVGATVFGYSNTTTVKVGWSVFHLSGVPLWTVALVPLALVLVAGTAFHWLNSLHHFNEHMRHRRRVRELEVELKSLRAHLDELLGMPDHSASEAPAKGAIVETEPIAGTATELMAPLEEPIAANGDHKAARKSRKRVSPAAASETGNPSPLDGEELAEPEPSNSVA